VVRTRAWCGASLGGMPGWFICNPALPRLERTLAGPVDCPSIVATQVVIVLAVSFKYLHSDAHTPQVRTYPRSSRSTLSTECSLRERLAVARAQDVLRGTHRGPG